MLVWNSMECVVFFLYRIYTLYASHVVRGDINYTYVYRDFSIW